jgi:Domain of unknown function (DUF4372)/Transposase DDE domain
LNRVCSIFSQLLQLFPRLEFERLVEQHKAERHARGFACWDQFVAMLFCQLGGTQSLREICGGLAATEGKLKHLGVGRAPVRSTLAYANQHRPWELYEAVFHRLLGRCQMLPGGHKFRFKNKLVSIDSTSIDLCATLFDWSRYKRTKGAAKVHLLLDHHGYLPSFAVITDGKTSDIEVARQFQFPPATVVVMDRAYVDYDWWERLTKQGVWFVTRFKSDLKYQVVEDRPVPQKRDIRADQVVRLSATTKPGVHHTLYRRIVLWVEHKQEEMVFFTNHLDWGATTVTAVYKDRWQIESFFKSLKQLLRVKTFVGTSPNALKTQIWTALIAMLLLKYLQLRSSFGWSLSNLCALLRQQLFVYRDLFPWLNDPYQPPPALTGWHDRQLTLDWKTA